MGANVNNATDIQPLPATTSRHAKPKSNSRWLSLLAWLGFAALVTLAVWAVSPWLIKQSSHEAVVFEQIKFKMTTEGSQDSTDWQTVTLPDTWAIRHQGGRGKGRYEIAFTIKPNQDLNADMPWAVRFDRLSFVHRIDLNGQMLHTDFQSDVLTGRPLAYLVQVPPGLLKIGRNRMTVDVQYSSLGGLSAPLIGRVGDVNEGHEIQVLLTENLPLGINIVAATFAAFLTLIWLKRRNEVAMGMLGLLCLVVSIRNCAYYVVHGPSFPPAFTTYLYFTAQTLATVLLGAFAMALTNKHWRWFNRLLWTVVLVYPLMGAIATGFDMLPQVRAVLYPGLLALMLPTLFILLRVPSQYGGWSAMGMVLGIAVSLIAGVHDYLRLQGLVSIMHTFWMPLATPITLASYGVVVVNRFVQVMQDVEQHNVQLESKVQARTRDLAAANAAKGHFLSAASHDLRQPVAAIGLLSGLLQERVKDTALVGITTRLMGAVHAMDNLLNGLLDLSRLDAGAITPHYQAIDLNDMLQRIATHTQESAQQKGLRLRLRPTSAVAWSDPVLLEQMVRNLVGNAIRYTSAGGVLVGVRRRGNMLSIEVHDTGAGIDAHDQARIFDDFVQLGNPERNQSKGLGLGLSIVRRASQLLNHPIQLKSQPGRGSCFAISVPLHEHATKRQHGLANLVPSEPTKTQALTAHTQLLADKHVVLLEDDTTLREALTLRLKAWGARVSAYDNLEDFDELLNRVMTIDLLITDHQLTDGNGLQALAMARAKHAALPVLIITGDTDPQHLLKMKTSGAPVLHKPFHAEALMEVLMALQVI